MWLLVFRLLPAILAGPFFQAWVGEMFKRLGVVVLAALTLGSGLTGCGGVDPDSPLGKRKAIFKDMLTTSEDLGGMLRGRLPFDAGRFAQGAQTLDTLSHQPWQHFTQVREGDSSAARPEVWQRQARFQDLARQLEAATGELVQATRQPSLDAAQLRAPMDKVESACRACHSEFRNH